MKMWNMNPIFLYLANLWLPQLRQPPQVGFLGKSYQNWVYKSGFDTNCPDIYTDVNEATAVCAICRSIFSNLSFGKIELLLLLLWWLCLR